MEKLSKQKDYSRCYKNSFNLPTSDKDCDKYISLATEKINNYLFDKLIKEVKSPETSVRITSQGKSKYDPMIYTGSGGLMYAYWRFYLLNKELLRRNIKNEYNQDTVKEKDILLDSGKVDYKSSKSFQFFEKSVKTHLEILEKEENSNSKLHESLPSSFFLGPPGIIIMSIIYYIEIKNKTKLKESLDKLLLYKKSAMSKNSEHEVLYGYAGYLWCLLFAQKRINSFGFDYDLSNTISEMFFYIIKEGIKYKNKYETDTLTWIFPSDTNVESLEDIYLGAAHGIMGNLYVLTECLIMYESQLSKNKEFKECVKLIENSFDYILKLQFESGNFPSALGKDIDNKLHFCHGACGAILVYIKAYTYFKKKEYMNSLLKAVDDIWERGIILKGNCICHGILGTSYALYAFYKFTKDKSYHVKSLYISLCAIDDEIQKAVLKQPDKQRKIPGISDSPYSLMEGNAGTFSLFCDLISGNVIFPGFEL